MSHPSFIICPALHIHQPLGDFFVFSLDATTLNRITFSLPAEAKTRLEAESDDLRAGYRIFGSQRHQKRTRLDEIADFIQSTDATFPNAIILAANYDSEGNWIENESARWTVKKGEQGVLSICIPDTDNASASIIDGQHRLHAFEKLPVNAPQREMELLCVVFLDLPTPYHAYVFATINFNQRKVDRSLAYELFGFDIEEGTPKSWVPETLAVYLARVLNTEKGSPMYRCILPAANVVELFHDNGKPRDTSVQVSMATVVDGILRLISRKPKEDRYWMRRPENLEQGRASVQPISDLPLRRLYIAGNDKAIYDVIANYFHAVRDTIWRVAAEGSYLRKTVGVQALFDVLRNLVRHEEPNLKQFSRAALTERMRPCEGLDPDGTRYQASGIGRAQVRNDILKLLKLG